MVRFPPTDSPATDSPPGGARSPGGAPPLSPTERLGDEIARLSAHIDAATYQLLWLIREFDEQEGWSNGFRSCAHWLSWRTSLGPGAAREKVRVARALGNLPRTSEAMRTGEISYSKARALTRMAKPETEEELLGVARHAAAAQLERMKNGWQSVERAEERFLEQERHAKRELWVIPERDGSWTLKGRVDPEIGAVLKKVLEAASEALYRKDSEAWKETPSAAKRADALGLVAEVALGTGFVVGESEEEAEAAAGDEEMGNPAVESDEDEAGAAVVCDEAENPAVEVQEETTPARKETEDARVASEKKIEAAAVDEEPEAAVAGEDPAATNRRRHARQRNRCSNRKIFGRAERFQVVLHVDADTLSGSSDQLGESRIDGGPRVSAEASRRLSCDCTRRVMVEDTEGNVLDVGRRSRTVPPALRRALERRDRGCSFPGCGLKICDGHHIVHWQDGGETKLGNLALLCRFHHRCVHEDGWRIELGPDQEVLFFRPDGRALPQIPEPPPVPERPVEALVRTHREEGIEMDAWTPTPRWQGERLDLGYAVDALIRWDERTREAGQDVSAETSAGVGRSG